MDRRLLRRGCRRFVGLEALERREEKVGGLSLSFLGAREKKRENAEVGGGVRMSVKISEAPEIKGERCLDMESISPD